MSRFRAVVSARLHMALWRLSSDGFPVSTGKLREKSAITPPSGGDAPVKCGDIRDVDGNSRRRAAGIFKQPTGKLARNSRGAEKFRLLLPPVHRQVHVDQRLGCQVNRQPSLDDRRDDPGRKKPEVDAPADEWDLHILSRRQRRDGRPFPAISQPSWWHDEPCALG
jgi:hypothetical protein